MAVVNALNYVTSSLSLSLSLSLFLSLSNRIRSIGSHPRRDGGNGRIRIFDYSTTFGFSRRRPSSDQWGSHIAQECETNKHRARAIDKSISLSKFTHSREISATRPFRPLNGDRDDESQESPYKRSITVLQQQTVHVADISETAGRQAADRIHVAQDRL
jgi:hypothetical protein